MVVDRINCSVLTQCLVVGHRLKAILTYLLDSILVCRYLRIKASQSKRVNFAFMFLVKIW